MVEVYLNSISNVKKLFFARQRWISIYSTTAFSFTLLVSAKLNFWYIKKIKLCLE